MNEAKRSVLIIHLTDEPSRLVQAGQISEEDYDKEMKRIHGLSDAEMMAELCVKLLSVEEIAQVHSVLLSKIDMPMHYEKEKRVSRNCITCRHLSDKVDSRGSRRCYKYDVLNPISDDCAGWEARI